RRPADRPARTGRSRGQGLLHALSRAPPAAADRVPAASLLHGTISGHSRMLMPPMRLSQFHPHTEKETPAEAELVSHRLMLKAGMIRKLSAGIYTWSPLGLRVLRRVEAVVREEMNAAGAIELLMPSIQPRELWDETGRWEKFGGQLLKIRDRKDAEY